MARLCAAVYEDWPIALKVARSLGYHEFTPIDHDDSQAMVVANEYEAVAVFRGTEATKGVLSDIMSNLGMVPVGWAGAGEVHPGYLHHLSRIRFKVAQILALHKDKQIVLTGHSLGGAIATLYAAFADHHALPIAETWTFGAPKALSSSSSSNISCDFFRVVDPVDFAPYHPLYAPWYKHPDRAVKIKVRNPGRCWGVISRHMVDGYVVGAAEA